MTAKLLTALSSLNISMLLMVKDVNQLINVYFYFYLSLSGSGRWGGAGWGLALTRGWEPINFFCL